MEHQNSILWEVTFWEFFFVTIVLGGAGAWLTGRAVARSWDPEWKLALYVVLLAAAVRFIHFALFQGTLLAPWYYVVDLVVLMILAFTGMRYTRAGQMVSRYGFLFRRAGPLGWSRKG